MDFNVGPFNIFVAIKLFYVATLPLTCVPSGFVVALSRHCLVYADFGF